MVNYRADDLTVTFSALADPTRLAIVQRLAEGGTTVKELARPFPISLPAISKHLRILQQAGLLTRQKQGRIHHCRLNPAPLREAKNWLTWYQQFWERQFDSLERFLQPSDYPLHSKEKQPWPTLPQPGIRPFKLPGPLKPAVRKSSKHGPIRKF